MPKGTIRLFAGEIATTLSPLCGWNQTDYEFPQWDLDRKSYMPAVPHLLIADGEKARFPDVALAPSRVVFGIVKDDSGKLVDGPYQVHCVTRHAQATKPTQRDKGQFTLSQLKPDVPLKFFIRKGNAVNIAEVFQVNELEAPLAFTISAKNQVSCTGRVVDNKGKPVSKAKILLMWFSDLQTEVRADGSYRHQFAKPLETLETDNHGKFAASGLWPQERFYVRVVATGYQEWVPPGGGVEGLQSAASGQTIEFSNIVLTPEKPKERSPFGR